MRHANLDMTFPSLCCRADEVDKDSTVADFLHNDDYREVNAFLRHDMSESLRYGEWDNKLVAKEILGVALIDLDDDQAPIEILTRDEAVDLLGWRWAENLEQVE